jgi:hypothetical protein
VRRSAMRGKLAQQAANDNERRTMNVDAVFCEAPVIHDIIGVRCERGSLAQQDLHAAMHQK